MKEFSEMWLRFFEQHVFKLVVGGVDGVVGGGGVRFVECFSSLRYSMIAKKGKSVSYFFVFRLSRPLA